MHGELKIHPDSHCPAVTGIVVEAVRTGGATLTLDYLLTGNTGALKWPRPGWGLFQRADELWKHTCFEAFIAMAGRDSYYEFNFATSMKSEAYHFDSYRNGMRAVDGMSSENFSTERDKDHCRLQIGLDLGSLPDISGDVAWRVGLSAVLEDTSGTLSYWALAHPPGKPDFHNAQSFTLELPPPAAKP